MVRTAWNMPAFMELLVVAKQTGCSLMFMLSVQSLCTVQFPCTQMQSNVSRTKCSPFQFDLSRNFPPLSFSLQSLGMDLQTSKKHDQDGICHCTVKSCAVICFNSQLSDMSMTYSLIVLNALGNVLLIAASITLLSQSCDGETEVHEQRLGYTIFQR